MGDGFRLSWGLKCEWSWNVTFEGLKKQIIAWHLFIIVYLHFLLNVVKLIITERALLLLERSNLFIHTLFKVPAYLVTYQWHGDLIFFTNLDTEIESRTA